MAPRSDLEVRLDHWIQLATRRWYGFGLAALFVTWLLVRYRFADPDLFARVAVGKIVDLTGWVARTDPFAFTQKKDLWIDHEWLSGVIFYWTLKIGGDPLLLVMKVGLAVLGLWILWRAHKLAWGEHQSLPLLILASFYWVFAFQSPVRCQSFTYVLVPLYFLGFVRIEKLGKPGLLMAASILSMPFWANAHGGFVLGLIFHGMYGASLWLRRSPHALAVSIAWVVSLLGTFLNPYGPVTYWQYILHAVTMKRPNIGEWEPLNPLSGLAMLPNLFAVLALAGLWGTWRREGWRMFLRFETAMVTLALVQGYRHTRLATLFVIVMFVFGKELVERAVEVFHKEIVIIGGKMTRAVLIVLMLSIPYQLYETLPVLARLPKFEFFYSGYPQKPLDWLLANRRGGNLLTGFFEGSYAFYRLFPRFKVAIDGRYEEVYTDKTFDLTLVALEPNNAKRDEAVRELNPDYMLVYTEELKKKAYPDPWQVIYQDKTWSILAKEPSVKPGTLPVETAPHYWDREAAPWSKALGVN